MKSRCREVLNALAHTLTSTRARTHRHARRHTHLLCFHPGVQFQPAAGKTLANYSLRAAFAAQHSMLFDTICLEFVESQVSFIEGLGLFSLPLALSVLRGERHYFVWMDCFLKFLGK